jgi:hypothetical protein
MSFTDRFEQLLQKQNIRYLRYGNLLLREYGQIIVPLMPVTCKSFDVEPDINRVFSELSGKLVWWSYQNSRYSDDNNWYGVIKSEHYEIKDYPKSKVRNQIKRGLSQNTIKKISVEELKKQGYEIYSDIIKRYGIKPENREDYLRKITDYSHFDDIIHFYGVFNAGKLVGYSIVFVYGDIEANISEIRILPEYNKQYASYALIHILSELYLKSGAVKYLSDGYRSLVHETNIQQFLISKFGFYKLPLYLNCKIKYPYNIVFNLLYPFRKLIKVHSVKAVFLLMKILNKQKSAGKNPVLL